MRIRYYLLLLLCVAMATLWMQVHLGIEKVTQIRLQKHSAYPIYVFMADSTLMPLIKNDLTQISTIANISVQSGSIAAAEVAEAYDLGITDDQLRRYRFPDIMSITFEPVFSSMAERKQTIEILQNHFHDEDIETHAESIDELASEIKILNRAGLYANIFLFLVSLLLTLWGKLNLELRMLLCQKLNVNSIVDKIRYNTRLKNQAFGLAFFPVLISFMVYYAMLSKQVIDLKIGLEFFGIQAVAFISSSICAYLIVKSRAYQAVNEAEINIVDQHISPLEIVATAPDSDVLAEEGDTDESQRS